MAWLWVVLVVVVLGFTAAVAVGRGGGMARAHPDRREVRLPAGRPVTGADLEDVEFSVVLRGYRMDEVDDVIERLVDELAARDARLARLEPRTPGPHRAEHGDDARPPGTGQSPYAATPHPSDTPPLSRSSHPSDTPPASGVPEPSDTPSGATGRPVMPPADDPMWRRGVDAGSFGSDPQAAGRSGSYPLYPRTGGQFSAPDGPREADPTDRSDHAEHYEDRSDQPRRADRTDRTGP